MNINEYFKDKELACPCCGALSVHRDALERLYITRMLIDIPLIINSACRCPSHNDMVKGSKSSLHIVTDSRQCRAFDIRCYSYQFRHDLVRCLFHAGFTRVIIHPNFVHADIEICGGAIMIADPEDPGHLV